MADTWLVHGGSWVAGSQLAGAAGGLIIYSIVKFIVWRVRLHVYPIYGLGGSKVERGIAKSKGIWCACQQLGAIFDMHAEFHLTPPLAMSPHL